MFALRISTPPEYIAADWHYSCAVTWVIRAPHAGANARLQLLLENSRLQLLLENSESSKGHNYVKK